MELCILILTCSPLTSTSNPYLAYSSVEEQTVTFTIECTFREQTLRMILKSKVLIIHGTE